MNKTFYPLFFSIIASLSFCFGDAQTVNTSLSSELTFNGEPYLAINPINNQNLVAAWMGLKLSGGTYKIAVTIRSSFDGGTTWSTATTLPHYGPSYTSADVSMAFDKNGLLYLSYIDSRRSPDSGGVFISRSRNGGLTWDTPSKVFDVYDVSNKAPVDRPWIVVDNSNTSNFGTLYITTKPAPWIAPPNRNYFKVSNDSGHTWTTIANVDRGTHLVGNSIAAPIAAPTTTLNGNFCAVYPSYVSSQNVLPAFYLATSGDKGQSFSYNTVIAYVPATLDTNLKGGYHLAADPADSNKFVLLAVDASNGDADIMALHSNDGGQTWSNRIRVNDDALSNGKDQDMVWCSHNERGNIAATWRDRRNVATNGFWGVGYDFYYALSNDNGQTFSSNKLLTGQLVPFDSILAQNGNDFMSCVYHQDTLYTVWGDTRSGKVSIFFAKTIASSDSTVGVVSLEGKELQWSIFPNPTTNILNIKVSPEMLGKEISVYDLTGKKIYNTTIQFDNLQIKTSTWAFGTYYIRAGNDLKRILKQ